MAAELSSIDQIITKILEFIGIGTELIRKMVEGFLPDMPLTIYIIAGLVGAYYLKPKFRDSDGALMALIATTIFLLINYV